MKQGILIADDVELNREILSDIFEGEYNLIFAENGRTAREKINLYKDELCAILLDIFMPEVSGIDLLEELGADCTSLRIPVLMITTDTSLDSEKRCLDLGATDFIKKPFSDSLVKSRVNNAINLYSYKNNLEEKVAEQTAKIKRTNHAIVELLGNLVESRNYESGEHVQRVSTYTRMLAQKMMEKHPEYNLTPARIDIIVDAAALHDVGKISISDTILLKPGRLTNDEFEIMKTHTTLGSEYILGIKNIWESDYSKTSYDIARYHHERYDGRGYPEGLAGDEIPISAQLVSVADVYDALIHERCYKSAIPRDKAFDMIINGECGTFSPKLLDCFEECFPFENI